MQRLSTILSRFFGSLPGLLLVAVAWDALIVTSLAPFSGPLRPLGLANLLGVNLGDAQRVGRIIVLYHSLAMPFVAALVYLVLDQVPMGGSEEEAKQIRRSIVVPITVGYMLTSIGGMTFGYATTADGGRSWIAHGIYLVGLSLVFYAGVLLAIALWPSRKWATDPARQAHLKGIPLERLAFFLVAVFTLVSAAIGGAAGAFFGNGFFFFPGAVVNRHFVPGVKNI
jgi:cbb3-type cytochrome oxidase subunit 3